MGLTDWIILGVILLCLCGAIYGIYRSKKQGNACVGCPHAGSCIKQCITREKQK